MAGEHRSPFFAKYTTTKADAISMHPHLCEFPMPNLSTDVYQAMVDMTVFRHHQGRRSVTELRALDTVVWEHVTSGCTELSGTDA